MNMGRIIRRGDIYYAGLDPAVGSEQAGSRPILIIQNNIGNLQVVDFYKDDGWSDTNFERPDFQRMLSDIKRGKINMVVVKDLSRFGRNYVDCGYYIEKVFDEYNVRFIAIDDGVDTLQGENMVMPIKKHDE